MRIATDSERSYVVEAFGHFRRGCDLHSTSCRQFLVTAAGTAGARSLAIAVETGLSGFLVLLCQPLGNIRPTAEVDLIRLRRQTSRPLTR